MADNSRVEDLRKRYHENPRRFFAPLANEYRKSGMLDRALLLCEKHVKEQPENMNGLVVYGQTLFELQQTEAAREPFEQALKLDPENLIALRHLGDIARLLGDLATAKSWYERVLELDRRNDEVLDLMAQLGGDAAPSPAPARPSTAASGLVSVASTVSVSGGMDVGMIDLGEPAAPTPPKPPVGKGGTVVINAQALAERDRKEADVASAVTQPVEAVPAPVAAAEPAAEVAAPRPSKRASLLDIDFDFSETVEPAETKAVPQAPVLGAEAAEYGFVDTDSTLIIEPPVAATAMTPAAPASDALGLEPTAVDALIVETTGDVEPLGLEPTIAEPASAPAPALRASDFELADYSGEVAPMAGLEATEFTTEQVAPMAELEVDSVSMTAPSVSPLTGLDRPDLTLDDVAPVAGLETAMAVPADDEVLSAAAPSDASGLEGLADLPLLEDPSATPPIEETPSARPKPRMTKADLASLPLLADFGLEDDPAADASSAASAASSAPTPIVPMPAVEPVAASRAPEPASASARASKATPTFVTETMAALYVQQGLLPEAIGVYRQLVEASPSDAGLRGKLAELERMHAQASLPAAAAPSDEMPDFDTPLHDEEPMPAPANAAMADVSFGDIGLKGQGAATPIVTPVVPAGPTAREFFGGFARRAAVVAAAVAAPVAVATAAPLPAAEDSEPPTEISASAAALASGWPLDALFGAASDVRDLHAAETLAGIGTFTGPDGSTGLGELLSVTAAPKRAVPRASETLKFDQFFQKPGTAAPAAAPGDDDLDQFQDWLKGLKK
ncbi:MAG: hypothetical protein C0503_06990 [Gemmatimonas sp.]|nr:hypothetical protein [Gemmatimonas sp.]